MVKPNKPPAQFSRETSSFRDPAGFIFSFQGQVYRQVNQHGQEDYDLLMKSGLYDALVRRGWLVSHAEEDIPSPEPDLRYKIIRPQPISFISYPYEWSFSQLKDAALLVLEIQKEALKHGAILKDSSAYNIQFAGAKPILIDTLSLSKYEEGSPWIAYRQFCQHFLAPIALMGLRDIRLSQLLKTYLDGIPLDLASRLLPLRTRLPGGLSLHIHLHALAGQRWAGRSVASGTRQKISKLQLLGIIDSLESTIRKIHWTPKKTAWVDYDRQHNYTDQAFQAKTEIVGEFLDQAQPAVVWDFGANTGLFSRLAAGRADLVISMDNDPGAAELNYLDCRQQGLTRILPLIVDLTNPSPAIGWRNRERSSLEERKPAGLVMALALIHHLCIANNLPLPALAEFFASCGEWLVIEFVPKEDSQVKKLLASRRDIFPDYNEDQFLEVFQRRFTLMSQRRLPDSLRTLYLFQRSVI